jgi:hypothetical protein
MHVAAHFSSSKVHCEICASFSDPPDVAVPCESGLTIVPEVMVYVTEQFATLSLQTDEPCRARGPPLRKQIKS